MDKISSLPPIIVTTLRRVVHPRGDILHGMKVSDPEFVGFGEAYFTTIVHNQIKGWKKHIKMTMNVMVPLGMVRFYIHDDLGGKTRVYEIGDLDYCRITIAAGYWVAFQGLTDGPNLILNLASIEHDPAEALSVPIERYPLTTP
jgi:dTDP-4-dehydrorhamnose 3,5-epimerase